ncbi:hypothetical protein LOAG_02147 [Loa loa]|uniref:Uncharacterized protein n=1 Tax=Loa loa TaxID=7209 RepID=A0A1S0U9B3_LOALO|nr:hypothetical protein LOAG_02147 [Loa loa]EFO26334.1 hypothetical protein LOAG_02147 [Loa loa]
MLTRIHLLACKSIVASNSAHYTTIGNKRIGYNPDYDKDVEGIQKVKTDKSVGIDGIPSEVWKHGGHALQANFHELVLLDRTLESEYSILSFLSLEGLLCRSMCKI